MLQKTNPCDLRYNIKHSQTTKYSISPGYGYSEFNTLEAGVQVHQYGLPTHHGCSSLKSANVFV